jgi:hypothetical protein
MAIILDAACVAYDAGTEFLYIPTLDKRQSSYPLYRINRVFVK